MTSAVLAFIAATSGTASLAVYKGDRIIGDIIVTAGKRLLINLDDGAEYIPVPADQEIAYFRAVHLFSKCVGARTEDVGYLIQCADILDP